MISISAIQMTCTVYTFLLASNIGMTGLKLLYALRFFYFLLAFLVIVPVAILTTVSFIAYQ